MDFFKGGGTPETLRSTPKQMPFWLLDVAPLAN